MPLVCARAFSIPSKQGTVMYKSLGLDFGEKTIGVAVSVNGRVAVGVTTLRRKDFAIRPCLKELKAIIREYEIRQLVLGFPKRLNGEDSPRCAETLLFKEKLERYFKNISVVLWDERLSTRAVSRVFEGKRGSFKKSADKMAAVYILQGYLDCINGNARKENLMANELPSFEDTDDGLVIINEEGEERPLQILANNEDESGIYLLAILDEEGEVFHFKCQPSEDDEDDVILEQLDKDHEDYNRVFDMFKDDYEELGINTEEI